MREDHSSFASTMFFIIPFMQSLPIPKFATMSGSDSLVWPCLGANSFFFYIKIKKIKKSLIFKPKKKKKKKKKIIS
jgi:hypothetical protein